MDKQAIVTHHDTMRDSSCSSSVVTFVGYRHSVEQYTGDLAVMLYGYHSDRTIADIAEAVYCLMLSLGVRFLVKSVCVTR